MAGDSLTTAGSQIVAYATKVYKFKDGRIAGACGDSTECRKLMRWLESGGDKPEVGEACAMVLNPDGTLEYWDKELEPLPYVTPMAIGSGGDLAIGAMLAGAYPEDAVRFAMERDRHSGGDITVIHRPRKLRRVA
jgi:ATP-dependent protease HslVU (ClpYQ) peptidase subunit